MKHVNEIMYVDRAPAMTYYHHDDAYSFYGIPGRISINTHL